MRVEAAGRAGVRRSLTLLGAFLVASAVILLIGAIALTIVLTNTIENEAARDERTSVSAYANAVLAPVIVKGNRLDVDVSKLAELGNRTRIPGDVRSVKVWKPDGTLALSTLAPDEMGQKFPVSDEISEVLETGKAVGGIEELDKDENRAEEAIGLTRAFEIYAPLLGKSGRPVGVFEMYLDPSGVDAVVADGRHRIWLTIGGVFLTLFLALVLLVRSASRRLLAQRDALRERSEALAASVGALELSSMEMVEALNTIVDAKDPYTAGHSQRVQQLAVALGHELGLEEDRLSELGPAALFHDIGKLAVPDAILLKPGKLDPAEFETIKQHASRGAEIVGKLSQLASAVPIVRHHHERWDGTGYPDRLAGAAIPLEAAIVGLADAWDAMTTDRPYAIARTLEASIEQVRAGRGTQFSPAVVDAFLALAARGELPAPISATAAAA